MEASKAGAPPLKFLFFFSVSDFSELLFPEERHVCVEGKTRMWFLERSQAQN